MSDILEFAFKNPYTIPFLVIVGLSFLFWKAFLNLKKEMKEDNAKFFEDHKKQHEEENIGRELREELRFFRENFELLKKAIDSLTPSTNFAIYKHIEHELNDLRERFIKNYSNGSYKDKAKSETSISQTKLIGMLNSSLISSSDRRTIFILVNFIVEVIEKYLIEHLASTTEQQEKLSLITIYFNNLTVLISYFQLKEIEYKTLDIEEIQKEINKDFDKLNSNAPRKTCLAEEL